MTFIRCLTTLDCSRAARPTSILHTTAGDTVTIEQKIELAEQTERYIRLRTGGTIRNLGIKWASSEETPDHLPKSSQLIHGRIEEGDDTLILTGRTSTYYNKQLATFAAIDGGENSPIQNDIKVH